MIDNTRYWNAMQEDIKMSLVDFLFFSPYVLVTFAIGFTGNIVTKMISVLHVMLMTMMTLHLMSIPTWNYKMNSAEYILLFFPISVLLNLMTMSIVLSRIIYKNIIRK